MAAHAQQEVQVLFFALGTRGDVQPLAVLADSLKCQEPAWAVTLATHAAHKARTELPTLLPLLFLLLIIRKRSYVSPTISAGVAGAAVAAPRRGPADAQLHADALPRAAQAAAWL